VSRVVWAPGADTNSFLVGVWDLKLRVSDKGVAALIPPYKEPRVVDEFEGKIPLRGGVDLIGRLLQLFPILPKGFA
jgi:hypothetical protein